MSIKHGLSNTRLFSIWKSMLTRCLNPNNKSYKYYGGKGVSVCDEWKNNFQAFYDWAISHGYTDNLTLDRMDSIGNYCPQNCRWVTMKEQNENKSNNRKISALGETLTLSQWSQKTGINITTLKSRIDKLGWSEEKAISTQVRRKKVINNA